ncbi:hypothetical protein I0C86_17140 [Plantactinospora sp. S1510]|uniref:Uncharacterized protein n=1 Tax=Plantactinospora alkalitolerans TaxID=2789879 RepID=A0ABS0GWS8_9ACTN|nr:hypothetical protein [Plantactinospora alkalitolerans]MBF9130670.1 hypothetical protein [Plantactinospora alkalitolerans]
MRFLRLYLRSRRVPLALATATAAITGVWALCLVYSDTPTIDAKGVSLTVMLAVAALAPTLGGADDALDQTASINWPTRRAGHLLLVATAIVALLLLSTLTDARFAPVGLVLRNTAGLLGLAALGAALFGTARSWIAPLTWTLVSVLPLVHASPEVSMQILGWLVQPAGTTAATTCAAVLGVTGLLAYALRGCPRHPAAETAPDR